MNQKTGTALLVIAAMIVGLAGIWYYSNHMSATPPIADTGGESALAADQGDSGAAQTPAITAAVSGSGKAASVLAHGGNYTCTFGLRNESNTVNWTVYVEDHKMRSDVSAQAAGSDRIAMSHSIRSGAAVYTWSEGAQKGTKVTIAENAPLSLPPIGGAAIGDSDSDVSWDCHPWLPVESEFVVPTAISFVAQ